MAAALSQDAVLHFLQSSGGSVKNSDLLLHFRNLIRDHADQDRNRQLFKKFVNSVATVRQEDGVSYVVLKKQFRGYVPGGGAGGSLTPPGRPAAKITEPSPQRTDLTPAVSAEKSRLKPPAPAGETAPRTILPAAGIMLNNNNKVDTNMKVKDLRSTAEGGAAQNKPLSEAPAQDQCSKRAQPRLGLAPVAPAVRHHGEASQQVPVPQTLKGREAHLPTEGALRPEPPLHHVTFESEVAPRRVRYRPSYKSAMSCDEDEEEDEELPMRRSSGGAVWPVSGPLRDMGRAISTSSPCIADCPAPSSVASSSSSSSERKPPKIFIQDVEEGSLVSRGLERSSKSGLYPVSLSGETVFSRHSPPLEAEHPRLLHDVPQDRPYSQSAGVQLEDTQWAQMSSSHSTTSSSSYDAGFSSSDWPPSSRGSGWNSSCEAKSGETGRAAQIQDVPQRAQGAKLSDSKSTASPWHHSMDSLHDHQESTAHGLHLSTGDLFDKQQEVESSDGSTSTPVLRKRTALSRRLSREVRNRMCRSLGTDLDQILQEEVRAGSDTARLNRLHLISSSLSLRANLSSSSLSSCSTPPRCHSLAELDKGTEQKEGRRSLPATASSSTTHHEGFGGHVRQSLVPLEPREHAWYVKAAAGAWPDIYSLFREDSSLLNKQDFISGFTVLHWIAKHGNHRVLNTLWYGVQKAGLTFNVNARSTCGHTPLHIAAIHCNKNIMRLLVKNFNADVKLRDISGKRPWQYLSCTMMPDIFQLLGAPARAALEGVGRLDQQQQQQQQHRRRRHHLSSASSGERPSTIGGTPKVKRSTSLAAFLKHKSLLPFHGQQCDASI